MDTRGVWPPPDAAALLRYIADHHASETHHVDFKREVGSSAKQRRGFAEHMASFATDGGWLVAGVDEPENDGTFQPAPIAPLAGQRERIDSIAHDVIDPPLYVESMALELKDQPTAGFIIVRIPPSPHVVHAVGGRYWGRRDVRKAALGDGDVARLIRFRSARANSALDQIDEEMAHTPNVPDGFCELLVRCTPRTPQAQPLWDFTAPWSQSTIHGAVSTADNSAYKTLDQTHGRQRPLTELCSSWQRRAGGIGWTSPQIAATRSLRSDADAEQGGPMMELIIEESGALQVWYAEHPVRSFRWPKNNETPVVADDDLVGITAALISLASSVSRDHMGFDGVWDIGVRIDGLHGLAPSYAINPRYFAEGIVYSDRRPYRAATTFTEIQAATNLRSVLASLFGSLLRSLGSERLLSTLHTPVNEGST